MNKAEMIDEIHDRVGLTKKDVTGIIDDIFDKIRETVLEAENVKITGFGNFLVKERGRRIGRNLKTGEEKVIPPRRVIAFQPSTILKDEINGK